MNDSPGIASVPQDLAQYSFLTIQAQEILNSLDRSKVALIFVNGSVARRQNHGYSDIDMRVYFFDPVIQYHFYKLVSSNDRPVLLNCQCIGLEEVRAGIRNAVRWYWFYHGLRNHILLYEARPGIMKDLLLFIDENKPDPETTVLFVAERIGNILEKFYKLKSVYLSKDIINVVRVTENIADDVYYVLRTFTDNFPPFVTENEIFPSYLKLSNVYQNYVEDISICKKFVVDRHNYIDNLYNAGCRLAINTIKLVVDSKLFQERREGIEWLSELLSSPLLDEYLKR